MLTIHSADMTGKSWMLFGQIKGRAEKVVASLSTSL